MLVQVVDEDAKQVASLKSVIGHTEIGSRDKEKILVGEKHAKRHLTLGDVLSHG
jgi:hypothetical protein